jgi:hypothetical protein
MLEPVQSGWQNFYVIIGSASATLIGLMFVVMTFVASRERHQTTEETIGAFATPTVIHLGAVLLTAVVLTAPWPSLWQAALLLSGCGMGGIIYMVVVARRARRQRSYQPVLEDWIWHVILPFLSYASFLAAGLALLRSAWAVLFVIGSAAVLLLFIGIHNAWDTITYLSVISSRAERETNKK